MPESLPKLVGIGMFQSAPDREAGRCITALTSWMTPECFNPRPTVRPGDA